MAKAIDFAVRTGAGTIVRGAVSGDGGSEFLQVGSGEAISLNLAQSSVTSYARQGKDLILKLTDGREITLSNYFESAPGEDNKLYLSSNGEISEVYLTDGGDGVMYANYGPADTWNKYSKLDDLRFTDDHALAGAEGYADDAAGMGPFVPGLLAAGMGGGGLGAAALAAGGIAVVAGGGGGGGDGGPRPPKVDDPESSFDLTTNTEDPHMPVTGTGEPGDKVLVTIGDKTQETVIGEDGKWGVDFPGDDLPPDGTYEAVVTVTDSEGNTAELDGPGFVIDMTPPEVAPTEGTESVGDIENLVDYDDGVTIAGEGEAGAKVDVKVGEVTHSTVIAEDGTWSVTFTQDEVAPGEYTIPVVITATDPMGNQTVVNDNLVVDTVPNPISINDVTADNVVNGAEAAAEGGVTVTGASAAGAEVEVILDGVKQTVVTGSDGTWSVVYPPGTFAEGEYDVTLVANTVDAAGNTSSTSHVVHIDTSTSVSFSTTADNVISQSDAASSVTLTGQAEAGATSVDVEWNGTTIAATVAEDGSWSVKFPPSAIPGTDGSSIATVTATDAAGNTATDTLNISVDQSINVSIDEGQVGGDDIISGAEADAGVTITGKAEAGSTVVVEFQDITRTMTADASGNWSASYAKSEIARGTYSEMVNVTATDAAGNTASATHTIDVDTEVKPFTRETLSTGSDDVLNNIEAQEGLTVTGTVEAGSTVEVSFGDAGPFNATVTGTTWSITVPKSAIPEGETNVTLTAVATDALGNVSEPHTETVKVDRIVTPLELSGGPISGDGMINAAEAQQGLVLTGSSEPYSTVVVALSTGAEHTIVVGADGTWTANFDPADLPTGDGVELDVTVSATDLAGNTASFSETVIVDTVAPGAPDVVGFSKVLNVVDGIRAETSPDTYEFVRVDQNGSTTDITGTNEPYRGSTSITEFDFDGTVPDGSYLVINTEDVAGNSSSTLMIVDNQSSSTVDLSRAGLAEFDLSTIDLTWAPQASMTISADQLIAMTGPDNRLQVKGGIDDQVTLGGDATLAGTENIDGHNYNVYHLGSGDATILLDDDIQTVI